MRSWYFEPILEWPRTLSCQGNSPDEDVGHRWWVGGMGGGVVDDASSVLTSARVATSANHLDAQEPHKSHMRVL